MRRLIPFALVLAAVSAPAITTTWTGTGDWFTNTANWSAGVPGTGDVAVVSNGTVRLTNSTQVLILSNSGTITFSNWNTTLTASNITLAGTLNHVANSATSAPWAPNGGIFIVCTNLTVNPGAQINADGCGYRSPTNNNGYGPGGGVYYMGGGGYGGRGGIGYYHLVQTSGVTYGSALYPTNPGSGGSSDYLGNAGGAGGGYVSIVAAGVLTVNGLITVNGADGWDPGGGSGGGILIQCQSLIGSGTLRANGGNITYSGGSGGGGRIAIHETSPAQFNGQISANCGGGAAFGFGGLFTNVSSYPGSIYLSDWSILPAVLTNGGGEIIAPTNTVGNVASLTISNYLLCVLGGWSNRLQVTSTVTVQNAGIICHSPNSGVTTNLTNWGREVGLWIASAVVNVQSNGKIMHLWNTATNVDVNGNWVPNAGVFIVCSNLNLASGGKIFGDKMGYFGSPTNGGPGGAKGVSAGGGYGGKGGDYVFPGGTTYGTATNPASPGSCGGTGPGGGYVQITSSGSLAINGLITVNGSDGLAGNTGGGSGGGVLIQCQTMTGNGTIRANGGYGDTAGGGGGRIAIYVFQGPYYTTVNRAMFLATVAGGTTYQGLYPFGTNGTVYLKYYQRGTQFSTW